MINDVILIGIVQSFVEISYETQPHYLVKILTKEYGDGNEHTTVVCLVEKNSKNFPTALKLNDEVGIQGFLKATDIIEKGTNNLVITVNFKIFNRNKVMIRQ